MIHGFALEILKKGVYQFNQFREEGDFVDVICLMGVDLSNAQLMGVNLSNVRLDSSNLSHANFRGANLKGASFSGANLKGTNFYKVNLSEADLSYANLSGSNLSNSLLNRANLSNTDLTEVDISSSILSEADLSYANLSGSNLSNSLLNKANLSNTDLTEVNFSSSNLSEAGLWRANLVQTNLSNTNLEKANLFRANLSHTNLYKSNLKEANLSNSTLIKTNISGANLNGCNIYGISVWDIHSLDSNQKDLKITPPGVNTITVDNLEVAQFVYLLLNNEKIRDVIDTITSKMVLILGRFSNERKIILDDICNEIRKSDYNLMPVIFDFNAPEGQRLLGTVLTLASMAKFVIADLSDPSMIIQELTAITQQIKSTPIQPIVHTSYQNNIGAYIQHIGESKTFLPIYTYSDSSDLHGDIFYKFIISPASNKREELNKEKYTPLFSNSNN